MTGVLEQVRRLIRSQLGYQSSLYRFGSKLLTYSRVLLKEGPTTLRQLERLGRRPRQPGTLVPIKLRCLAHPLLIRPGTNDISVVLNNLIREEYGQLQKDQVPKTLIDAGAYIGDTAVYFLSAYPDLFCLALEPNPKTFEIAAKNLAPYGSRASLRHLALTNTGTPVALSGDETGSHIEASGTTVVMSTTIHALLEELGFPKNIFLKLDIEGAEVDIFADNPEQWLVHLDGILVETHSRAGTKVVLDALTANNWSYRLYRNLYYCRPRTSSMERGHIRRGSK